MITSSYSPPSSRRYFWYVLGSHSTILFQACHDSAKSNHWWWSTSPIWHMSTSNSSQHSAKIRKCSNYIKKNFIKILINSNQSPKEIWILSNYVLEILVLPNDKWGKIRLKGKHWINLTQNRKHSYQSYPCNIRNQMDFHMVCWHSFYISFSVGYMLCYAY